MEHTESDDKPVGYRHVQALVRNLDDPKAAVRIASLRAAARLAGLEDVVFNSYDCTGELHADELD